MKVYTLQEHSEHELDGFYGVFRSHEGAIEAALEWMKMKAGPWTEHEAHSPVRKIHVMWTGPHSEIFIIERVLGR